MNASADHYHHGLNSSPPCLPFGTVLVDGERLNVSGLSEFNFGTVEIIAAGVDGPSSASKVTINAGADQITVHVVEPPKSWGNSSVGDKLKHLNLQLDYVTLSSRSHGLLGVTNRKSSGMVPRDKDGTGVIEGNVTEYELTSITDTDFKYSVFHGDRAEENELERATTDSTIVVA